MEKFNISVPFEKVNKEKRTVTGIATGDNADLEDDKIDFSASVKAFTNWIGNIREMHGPKAVGKALNFRDVPFSYEGKNYMGIELEAYVSKGAQDTWEKVLDGTLKGFSIGGKILGTTTEYHEDTDKVVRVITDLQLLEVSLVDNPANPAATFTMIKSLEGGDAYSSDLKDVEQEVFYCKADGIARMDTNECRTCGTEMESIGYVSEFESEIISKMISSYKNGGVSNLTKENSNDIISNMDADLTDTQKSSIVSRIGDFLFGETEQFSKAVGDPQGTVLNIYTTGTGTSVDSVGGHTWTTGTPANTLSKSTDVVDEVAEEETEEEEVTKAESTDDADVVKSEETNKEEDEMDLEKFMGDLTALLDEKVNAIRDEVTGLVDSKIDEVQKSVDTKFEEHSASIEEVKESVDSSGAVKKSLDVDDEDDEVTEEVVTKSAESFWGGIFIPEIVSKSLGYDS